MMKAEADKHMAKRNMWCDMNHKLHIYESSQIFD
jgi:hypothetical protein